MYRKCPSCTYPALGSGIVCLAFPRSGVLPTKTARPCRYGYWFFTIWHCQLGEKAAWKTSLKFIILKSTVFLRSTISEQIIHPQPQQQSSPPLTSILRNLQEKSQNLDLQSSVKYLRQMTAVPWPANVELWSLRPGPVQFTAGRKPYGH